MEKKNILKNSVLYVSLLAFILFVVYVFSINQELLYAIHERSEFIYGATFYDTLISKPFGLMQYAGAWLTQFFYNPVLGSGLLAVIWILIFIVGVKAFRLKGAVSALMLLPVACLLTSIVDLGYWIYTSPIRGYWFSQSLGYLVMLLLLCIARCTPRKWHIVWYLVGFALYPVFGWFALLFVLCLVLADKISWREIIGVVIICVTAHIWQFLLYSNLNIEQVTLAGFPRFITASDCTPRLSIPFWALGAVSVLIALINSGISTLRKPAGVNDESQTNDRKSDTAMLVLKTLVPVVCLVAGVVFTWTMMYQDKNYVDEMRMVRYAQDDNWKEVLAIAEKAENPTGSMVMLKNVALMNEGGLLDRAFTTVTDAAPIYNPDSVHVSFLEIASPVVYYNYGLLNEAIRLNYECAVQSGFCPFYLKSLSRCLLATGEKNQEERFNTVLHQHPGYKDWNPKAVPAKVTELQHSYLDELTGVENTDSYLVNSLSLWYDTNSKEASTQALYYSMFRRDSRRFWRTLRQYLKLHNGENFPIHAQEAYIMYMDKAPEEKRMMIPVEQKTYDNYKKFWATLEELVRSGVSQNEIPEKMKAEFGGTYWYYNIFAKKVY